MSCCASAITFRTLRDSFHWHAPVHVEPFAQTRGFTHPDTSALKMSLALWLCDKTFFDDPALMSGIAAQWQGLPTTGAGLQTVLTQKMGPPQQIHKSGVSGRQGIVLFDTSAIFGGTGHLALWDRIRVVDGGDYFNDTPWAYFWPM